MSKSIGGNVQVRQARGAAAGVAIVAALIALGALGYTSPNTAAQAMYAPPVAVDDALTTEKNTAGTVNVLTNDTDPDEGDTLSVTGVTDPPHGSVVCTAAGSCTYTPDTDFVGADSFDYTVSDSHAATDIGTVRVTVTAPPCAPAVCIDNGTILLAVNPTGELNDDDGTGSAAGGGDVGLHFMPTGNEATSPGCLCEGWGAADASSEVAGYANQDEGGAHNMTVESFTSTPSTAVSVVRIHDGEGPDMLRVTHDYHPSPATPNLYEVIVTIQNIADGALSDIRYRRVMDWDVEPTPFNEFVTINGGTATQLLFDSNNGFETANPLGPRSGVPGPFTDLGPDDHGALFDFGFGTLGPGATATFRIFYGAAADEAGANAAVAASGAEVFSYGQPSTPDGPTLGTPNTFIFAFGGVGGAPIFPTSPPPAPAPLPGPPPPPPAPTPADLTITIQAEELPPASSLRRLAVAAGTRMRYLVTVTNNGPGIARNVTLSHGAPAGSSFDSISTDTGSCSGSSTVSCSFGSLAVGQQAHVTTTATLAQAGSATATASVSASEPDPASGNNSASTTTNVTASVTGQGVPVFGTTAVPVVVSGFVCVQLPNTTECVDISTLTEIPVGSIIDTTRGRMQLTVATSAGALETVELYEGVFQLLQSTTARSTQARSQAASVTELKLTGGDFSKCTAKPAKAKAKKAKKKRKPAAIEQDKPRQRVRRLWGAGAGSFRTRGRYSSATVRGTVWLTEDYCNGTLIRVQQGSVTVRDLVKNRTVVVAAGKSYFAEAPAPKAAKAKAKPKKRKPAAG